jgi:hypothetical protein
MSETIDRLELLVSCLKRCERLKVRLYEQHYYYESFGSWEIVIGRPHKRMRFIWDRKENQLITETSLYHNSKSWAEWEHYAETTIGELLELGQIFTIIEEHLTECFHT